MQVKIVTRIFKYIFIKFRHLTNCVTRLTHGRYSLIFCWKKIDKKIKIHKLMKKGKIASVYLLEGTLYISP